MFLKVFLSLSQHSVIFLRRCVNASWLTLSELGRGCKAQWEPVAGCPLSCTSSKAVFWHKQEGSGTSWYWRPAADALGIVWEVSLFAGQSIFDLYGRAGGISGARWTLQHLPEGADRISGWLGWKGSLEILQALLEQVHPEEFAQDCVQACFEYLQRKRLHSLSGQPVRGLCHLTVKKFFLEFK